MTDATLKKSALVLNFLVIFNKFCSGRSHCDSRFARDNHFVKLLIVYEIILVRIRSLEHSFYVVLTKNILWFPSAHRLTQIIEKFYQTCSGRFLIMSWNSCLPRNFLCILYFFALKCSGKGSVPHIIWRENKFCKVFLVLVILDARTHWIPIHFRDYHFRQMY